MIFTCKSISTINEEFGCTITLYENENEKGRYLILQRTYAEIEDERDSRYIETSDFENSGFYNKASLHLYPNLLSIIFDQNKVDVLISPSTKDFNDLKSALKIISDNTWDLTIHEQNSDIPNNM